jgi:hypothetical protein
MNSQVSSQELTKRIVYHNEAKLIDIVGKIIRDICHLFRRHFPDTLNQLDDLIHL